MDSIHESLRHMHHEAGPQSAPWAVMGMGAFSVFIAVTLMFRNVGRTKFSRRLERDIDDAESEISDSVSEGIVSESVVDHEQNGLFSDAEMLAERQTILSRRLASVDSKLEDVPEMIFAMREGYETLKAEGRTFTNRLDTMTNKMEKLLTSLQKMRAEQKQLETQFILERNALEVQYDRDIDSTARENENLRNRIREFERSPLFRSREQLDSGVGSLLSLDRERAEGGEGSEEALSDVNHTLRALRNMGVDQDRMRSMIHNMAEELTRPRRRDDLDLEGRDVQHSPEVASLRQQIMEVLEQNDAYKQRVAELEEIITSGALPSEQTADQLAEDVMDATEQLMAGQELASGVAEAGLEEEDSQQEGDIEAYDSLVQEAAAQKARLEEENKRLVAELEESKKRVDELEPLPSALQAMSKALHEQEGQERSSQLEGREGSAGPMSKQEQDTGHVGGQMLEQEPSNGLASENLKHVVFQLKTKLTKAQDDLFEARAQRDDISKHLLIAQAAAKELKDELVEVKKDHETHLAEIRKRCTVIAWRLIQTTEDARGWGSSTADDISPRVMSWATPSVQHFVDAIVSPPSTLTAKTDGNIEETIDHFVSEIEHRRTKQSTPPISPDLDHEQTENEDADVSGASSEAVEVGSERSSLSGSLSGSLSMGSLSERAREIEVEVGELGDVGGVGRVEDVGIYDGGVPSILGTAETEEERERELKEEVEVEGGSAGSEVYSDSTPKMSVVGGAGKEWGGGEGKLPFGKRSYLDHTEDPLFRAEVQVGVNVAHAAE
ncbi:hypothetical protein HDV00_003735 [Rhizophlyctis rosea]|nr:hypothetical protein HDV00_003735 [Rhizophlyctis rosea]